MEGGIDGDTDNSQSAPAHAQHKARSLAKMKEKASSPLSATLQPLASPNCPNAEAGPSRDPHRLVETEQSHAHMSEQDRANFAGSSRFSPSILPKAKIRGTEDVITDWFHPCALAEIDDLELLQDLSLLGPPPQPAAEREGSSRPQPYWGISSERFKFFTAHPHQSDQAPIQVNPTVQANVERYHQLKHQGLHFNQVLLQNRSFKNPHVYSHLVDLLDIDETRSNLPLLDTGMAAGGWRSMFPFSTQQLIDGDPIAMLQRQKQELVEKRNQKLHKGHSRKIEFASSRHNDQGRDSADESRASSWADSTRTAKRARGEDTGERNSRHGRHTSAGRSRVHSSKSSSKQPP